MLEKRNTYYVKEETSGKFLQVESEAVPYVLPYAKDLDLFLHYPVCGVHGGSRDFVCVSEGKTGFLIAWGVSQHWAINSLKNTVRRVGLKVIREEIDRLVSLFGYSPRYVEMPHE